MLRVGQSKRGSFAESLVNVAIGYWVAVLSQAVVFPWFGLHTSLSENMSIGLVFTGISIVRSFTLRRLFNWWHLRGE